VANTPRLPRNGAVDFIDWLGLFGWFKLQGFCADAGYDLLVRDPAGRLVFHGFVQYDLASRYIPAHKLPFHIVFVQVWRVIQQCRGCVSSRDTKNVNIGDVAIEVVDDSKEL